MSLHEMEFPAWSWPGCSLENCSVTSLDVCMWGVPSLWDSTLLCAFNGFCGFCINVCFKLANLHKGRAREYHGTKSLRCEDAVWSEAAIPGVSILLT